MTADARAGAPLHHGGRLAEAARRFPGAPTPWLDLSTGINPVPYPVPPIPPELFHRLPEPEALRALQDAAAAAYGVSDPDCVVAAPGTQILIETIPRLFPHRAARVLSPTYAEHAAAWRAAGSAVREVAAPEDLLSPGPAAAVLCHPNNPDGRRFDPARLSSLADRVAAGGGLLLVDEAFADLEPDLPGLAPLLPRPGLILLRSFGKSYGLAGLRLGFALAAPGAAAVLRAALGPWAVSGPALWIGAAALRDREWRASAAARLADDAARLDAMLSSAGLEVLGGTRLFRFARAPGGAGPWFERLGRAGILCRRFEAMPDRLRFGLPGAAPDWDRLEAALSGPAGRDGGGGRF